MIAWILERAKERSTWMGLFSLAGAVGLAVTPEHKELVITAAVAVLRPSRENAGAIIPH